MVTVLVPSVGIDANQFYELVLSSRLPDTDFNTNGTGWNATSKGF